MLEILIRLTKHYVVRILQLPVSLWINFQWANLKYRETCHLLRLDDYLLKDMGLRKVDGRIEVVDTSRIDPDRPVFGKVAISVQRGDQFRHAD